MTAPIETPPAGLREALEDMVAKADRRAEERRGIGRAEIPARVGIDAIRGLLAAHPEPAPVASREHVTEALLEEWVRRAEDRTVASPEGHCLGHADALLAAGVFRDEAEVKAEALREAADDDTRPQVDVQTVNTHPAIVGEDLGWLLSTHPGIDLGSVRLIKIKGTGEDLGDDYCVRIEARIGATSNETSASVGSSPARSNDSGESPE